METALVLLSLIFGSATALQCDISGECGRHFIGCVALNSSKECLATCKGIYILKWVQSIFGSRTENLCFNNFYIDTEACAWYTFVPEAEI